MKLLDRLFKTREGRIIVSIIWGLGLACLFKKVCTGRDCIVFKAPDPKYMTNNVFYHNTKCYKYTTETTKCTKDAIKHY